MVLYDRTARVGIYATYMSSCSLMYWCVLRYCDACLKSCALRVGVHTLHNTQCQLVVPVLVLFSSKMQVWTFWYILLLCESPLFRTIFVN